MDPNTMKHEGFHHVFIPRRNMGVIKFITPKNEEFHVASKKVGSQPLK